jgi:hypothetical protein
MDEVIIYCPPTGTTITGECSTTESLIWQEESVNYIQFFVPFVNDQLIKFDLTNIANNGSNVELDLIYYVNGVYGSVKNVDLGVITSPISLYHFLDFGTTPGVYNYITLQFTISGGTTGQIDVTLDCDVDVVSQLFCSGATFTDACNCEQQITIYAEIIEDGLFPFQGSSWFLDASLQTPVPCGNYVPINPSNIPNSKYLNYYYNCSTNLPEIYGYCTSVCNEISCSGGTSTFTHIPQTYNNMNPLVETNLRNSKSEIVIEDKYNFSKVNRFSTHCVTIVFPQGSVGIYPITITYDGTDSREKYITFEDTAYFRTEDSPGQVSYSDEIPSNSPWFIPMNTDYLVNFKVNKTYYIIPPKSGRVTIKFSIGNSTSNIFVPPSSITTTITPSCVPTPIYKYNAGLHVYSAYDSIISPRCTTTVYSITPLGSWTKNSTVLFNDNWFVQPAFPYWYSVSGTTYKVGEQLKRDWGVIHQYKIRKKIASRAVNVTKQTSAYQNQMITDLFSGQRTLPSCVENVGMLGVIRDIVAQILVIQPTKYKYYVGVSDFPNTTIEANKITANDKYFNLIDAEFAGYSNDYCYPVTGFEFAVVKLSLAYALFIPPYLDNFTAQRLQYENMTKLLQSRAVSRSNFMTGLAMAIVATVMVGLSFGPKDGFVPPTNQGNSRYERGALKNHRDGAARCPKWIARIPKVGPVIEQLYSMPKIAFSIEIAVALALVLLVQWLIPINRIVNECCRLLKVINTTNPYIFVGDYIFLNQNMTTPYQYGWLCDGAYYYKVIDGYVHEKQLSYTYRGVQYTPGGGIGLGTGPKIVSLLPDSPTYVADIPSLFFLPYVSGVPDGFITNPLYQSQKISGVTLTDSSVTGALYDPLQNEYVLEEGFITSDISQQDADDRAVEFFDSVTANTQSMFGGLTYSPNTDYVSTIFTNEIKLEYNPRELLLFYDNTDLSGLTIGKTAYVDLGFSEALSGYYSLSSDTAYRKFYLILSGSVEDIYTMTTSASTSVTSYLSGNTINISQTDRDFTSGWYLKSDQPIFLPTLQNRWNSPEFYQSSEIVRGFLKTPSSADTFYIYSSNQGVASGYSEANESFYQEILTDAEMFQYYLPQTLLINQVQTCSFTGSGIDFQVTDISGNSTNSLYGVAFNAVIFTANTYDSTHSISIQSYETNKLLELPFEYNGQITDVQISGFTSQNPINKITFSAGTFTSCNTPSPTPTPTPTITPSPSGLPTIYVSVCYDSVIPQDDFIVDFNFYTQSSGDSCGADQTLPLDYLSITFEAYPNNPYDPVGGIVTISGNSCVVVSGEVLGDNITGFTITDISTPYSNNANYVVGTICSSGSCATCLSETPTPTPTPTITTTQTETPTNTPTSTPTVTETNTPTPTVTQTNTPTVTQTNTPTVTQTNTPTVTETNTPTPTVTQTNTPTPSATSGQTPTLNMVIAGVYSNVYELGIDLSINGGSTPDSAVLYFEWCTDSTAVGNATFNINASVTGSLQIPNINLSSTGTDTQFTGWGSYTYNVTTSSTSQLNALYVKTSTITYTTSDTTTRVVIDFVGVDNDCSNQQSYVDYCVAKCDL